LDQAACVAGWFVGVSLFEFVACDAECDAFDRVCRVAGKFKVAMIGSAARGDEVFVVDAYEREAMAGERVGVTVEFPSEGSALN
jgi:hypothetical protein